MDSYVEFWNPVMIRMLGDGSFRAAMVSHETMLVSVLDAILDRYERDPGYPYLDTKLNIITGEDFMPAEDPTRDFKSKRTVYGWIQGRGLEALAGHAEWLPECTVLDANGKRNRIAKLNRVIVGVLDAMESVRGRNRGRVPFMMTTGGEPLGLSDAGRLDSITLEPDVKAFGDMFYSKGLYAAAKHLGMTEKAEEAEAYFREVVTRVECGGFVTDQQPFDPRNKVRPVPGRTGQGPHMIGLFGISLIVETTGSDEWIRRGRRFVRHILDNHIIKEPSGAFELFDFVEAIDGTGNPWVESDGAVLCDAGHALECVGAMARFLYAVRACGADRVPEKLFDTCRRVLPRVLVHIFKMAWNAEAGGICKTYDLIGRHPHNDDMPWWNLPETIRAAALLLHLFPGHDEEPAVQHVLAECSNAFLGRYVNPDVHLMAYQTRNARGEPVDVIPATPDADPGYHTGLAIIDVLRVLDGLQPHQHEGRDRQ